MALAATENILNEFIVEFGSKLDPALAKELANLVRK
jgi:hypothetical protein